MDSGIDEIIARKYDEEAVASIAPEARAQLAVDAKVLLYQARVALEGVLGRASARRAAGEDNATIYQEVKPVEVWLRVAEANQRIATKGMDGAWCERVRAEAAQRIEKSQRSTISDDLQKNAALRKQRRSPAIPVSPKAAPQPQPARSPSVWHKLFGRTPPKS